MAQLARGATVRSVDETGGVLPVVGLVADRLRLLALTQGILAWRITLHSLKS